MDFGLFCWVVWGGLFLMIGWLLHCLVGWMVGIDYLSCDVTIYYFCCLLFGWLFGLVDCWLCFLVVNLGWFGLLLCLI